MCTFITGIYYRFLDALPNYVAQAVHIANTVESAGLQHCGVRDRLDCIRCVPTEGDLQFLRFSIFSRIQNVNRYNRYENTVRFPAIERESRPAIPRSVSIYSGRAVFSARSEKADRVNAALGRPFCRVRAAGPARQLLLRELNAVAGRGEKAAIIFFFSSSSD